MKKNNFVMGFVYVIVGVIFLLIGILTDSSLDSLLFGFSGAGIVPGMVMICKYFYWSSPKNKELYKEKLANDAIEQHDELKTMLRDKSGRYAYVSGLVIISISIVAFSVLGQLEIIDNTRTIVLYLGAYLIFQFVIGIVSFRQLLRKYR